MYLSPNITESGFSSTELQSRLAVYQDLRNRAGDTIRLAAQLTNVPEQVLYAFAIIESNGDPRAGGNSRYQGYMQIDTGTATVEIYYAHKQGRLNLELRQTLAKLITPAALACIIGQMKNETLPSCQVITRNMLWNPLLNIIVGGLYLRRLMNRYTENGQVRYDKVVVAYNRGAHIENKFPMQGLSVQQVYNQVTKYIKGALGKITQQYIAKLIGQNGILPALSNFA